MNNQECKVRPRIVNVNSEEPVFFPLSIKTSKFRGSCNNINNLYAKLCVLDVAKNLNIKEFNRMSETMKLMKQDTQNGMKVANINVDQIQMFVNAYVNAKNLLLEVDAIKDLFGILVIVSVNVTNHQMMVNVQTMETVRAEKNQLLNQLKNVLKMLKK